MRNGIDYVKVLNGILTINNMKIPIQKERTDKLIQALWTIANDLPVSTTQLQNIAKNALEYDKVVYKDGGTIKPK